MDGIWRTSDSASKIFADVKAIDTAVRSDRLWTAPRQAGGKENVAPSFTALTTGNVTKEKLRNVQETVRKRRDDKETSRYQGDTETCFYFTNKANNHAPHAFCHITQGFTADLRSLRACAYLSTASKPSAFIRIGHACHPLHVGSLLSPCPAEAALWLFLGPGQ